MKKRVKMIDDDPQCRIEKGYERFRYTSWDGRLSKLVGEREFMWTTTEMDRLSQYYHYLQSMKKNSCIKRDLYKWYFKLETTMKKILILLFLLSFSAHWSLKCQYLWSFSSHNVKMGLRLVNSFRMFFLIYSSWPIICRRCSCGILTGRKPLQSQWSSDVSLV